MKYGTSRFVLISTDKAVNPTNIMGASKRICEMVIQSMDAISKAGRFDMLPFLHAHMDKASSEQSFQNHAQQNLPDQEISDQMTADSVNQPAVETADKK